MPTSAVRKAFGDSFMLVEEWKDFGSCIREDPTRRS